MNPVSEILSNEALSLQQKLRALLDLQEAAAHAALSLIQVMDVSSDILEQVFS